MLSFFKERSYFVGAFPEFEYYCHSPLEDMNGVSAFVELLHEGRLIALIAKLAQRLSNEKTGNAALIRPALSALHSERRTPPDNEELARLCNLSKNYFTRIFKEMMGVSPHRYYITLIINKGAHLLVNSAYKIGEISRLCGMDDSLYFSRLFKKHMGLSPKAYREKSAREAR